ncbi:MAG: hypothetical protein AAF664_08875 [Planctomycetota bacterium]
MFDVDIKQATAAIRSGRLEEAAALLLKPSNRNLAKAGPLIDRLVSKLIDRGRQHLDDGRVQPAHADAKTAMELAGRQIPIMELMSSVQSLTTDGQQEPIRKPPTFELNDSTTSRHPPLLLGVGGLGRLLLLRGKELTLDGVVNHRMADILLKTSGIESPLRLIRSDDEGEIRVVSRQKFEVNGTITNHALLVNDDVIVCGNRGRIRIRRGVPASQSIVFELTDSRTSLTDVRYIVWMAESIVLAPKTPDQRTGVGCHFRVPELSQNWMIVDDDSQWSVRPVRRLTGWPSTSSLNLGQDVYCDDVAIRLNEVPSQGARHARI